MYRCKLKKKMFMITPSELDQCIRECYPPVHAHSPSLIERFLALWR